MMLQRQHDAAHINEIVNDPSVYPWVSGRHTGPLDVSPLIADGRNVALFGEHGGVIFVAHQPGLYEAHTQVLPAGRGRWTFDTVNAALHWMFTRSDAIEIMTRCPHGNLGAKALARAIHGELEFTNPRGWTKDGNAIPADIYSLDIQRWMKTAPGLPERGRWFHDRLEAEYAGLGKAPDLHADDETHDRYVGAAVDMMLGGQPHKGVVFYNRWAVMADYATVGIVTETPLVIDIRDALLCVRDNDFWVMATQ